MPSFSRFAFVLAFGATALLTACAPDGHQLSPTSAAPTSSPAPEEGTFDPETDPVNPSVGVDCRTLVNDDVIYEWGSGNFALDVDYEPATGSIAAQLAAMGGIACSWVNLTSSETVSIAVASPLPENRASAAAAAAAVGEPAPLISDEAFISMANGVGHVEAFTDKYWIAADSTWFVSQEDAAPLLTAAIDVLG